MKKLLVGVCVLLPVAAWAQSNPGFIFGQVPTAAQWNSYFAGKADYPLTAGALPAFGSGDVSFASGGGVGTIANNAVIAAKISNGAVTEGKLGISDVTTGNVSTTAHGFAPKAPNDATKYLDGTGAYSVPAGTGSVSVTAASPDVVITPSPGTSTFTIGSTDPANTQSGTTYAPADCSALAAAHTLFTATSAVTFTMPNVSQTKCGSGAVFRFSSAGTSPQAVTFNITAPSKINGQSSYTLPAGQSVVLADPDGLNYVATPRTDLGTMATQNANAVAITGGTITGASIAASEINSGTVAVAQGGTNLASYAVGDVLYASGATTLNKLADVATGQVLHSGGVGAAPAYSAIVVGDLPGSGATTVNGQSCALNASCHVITGILSGGDANWPQATTQYAWVQGGENAGNGANTSRQELAPAAVTLGFANGIGGFYCHATTAPPGGQTFTLTLQKNGSDTTAVCTIDSTGAGNDLTHGISFAAGDQWNMKIVSSATSGTSPLQWGITAQQ